MLIKLVTYDLISEEMLEKIQMKLFGITITDFGEKEGYGEIPG